MKLVEHHIDMFGPACEGRYARPGAVGRVLSHVGPLAVETLRMGVLHRSRKVGRPWKELAAAWDVRHGGQEASPEGGTRLLFTAPMLKDAAPSLFEQGVLWDEGPNPEATAFDMIGPVVADVRAKKRDSERYDTDLLRRFTRFDPALRRGVDRLTIGGHQLDGAEAPVIDTDLATIAREWVQVTPQPKRVRVSGQLDMIRVSDRVFELVLADGNRVRAVWAGPTVVHLREYLDDQVLIEGDAVFRPSGSLLRIDAEAIAHATEQDAFFSTLPMSSAELRHERLRVRQTPTTGVNAIWGQWAGDESEEEMLKALEKMS